MLPQKTDTAGNLAINDVSAASPVGRSLALKNVPSMSIFEGVARILATDLVVLGLL